MESDINNTENIFLYSAMNKEIIRKTAYKRAGILAFTYFLFWNVFLFVVYREETLYGFIFLLTETIIIFGIAYYINKKHSKGIFVNSFYIAAIYFVITFFINLATFPLYSNCIYSSIWDIDFIEAGKNALIMSAILTAPLFILSVIINKFIK